MIDRSHLNADGAPKRGFVTQDQAREAAVVLFLRNRDGHLLHDYECHCGWWHVGHTDDVASVGKTLRRYLLHAVGWASNSGLWFFSGDQRFQYTRDQAFTLMVEGRRVWPQPTLARREVA